jgi:hypothetical protein
MTLRVTLCIDDLHGLLKVPPHQRRKQAHQAMVNLQTYLCESGWDEVTCDKQAVLRPLYFAAQLNHATRKITGRPSGSARGVSDEQQMLPPDLATQWAALEPPSAQAFTDYQRSTAYTQAGSAIQRRYRLNLAAPTTPAEELAYLRHANDLPGDASKVVRLFGDARWLHADHPNMPILFEAALAALPPFFIELAALSDAGEVEAAQKQWNKGMVAWRRLLGFARARPDLTCRCLKDLQLAQRELGKPRFSQFGYFDALPASYARLPESLRLAASCIAEPLHEQVPSDSFPTCLQDIFKSVAANLAAHQKPFCGLLLYGSSGTGKTFFVRSLATRANLPLVLFSEQQHLKTKWCNESENKLTALCEGLEAYALERNTYVLLFVDEIDTFTQNVSGVQREYFGVMLTNLNPDRYPHLLRVGATSRLDDLAGDIRRRFGNGMNEVRVTLPESTQVVCLMRHHLTAHSHRLSAENFDAVAARLTGRAHPGTVKAVLDKAVSNCVAAEIPLNDTAVHDAIDAQLYPSIQADAKGVLSLTISDFDPTEPGRCSFTYEGRQWDLWLNLIDHQRAQPANSTLVAARLENIRGAPLDVEGIDLYCATGNRSIGVSTRFAHQGNPTPARWDIPPSNAFEPGNSALLGLHRPGDLKLKLSFQWRSCVDGAPAAGTVNPGMAQLDPIQLFLGCDVHVGGRRFRVRRNAVDQAESDTVLVNCYGSFLPVTEPVVLRFLWKRHRSHALQAFGITLPAGQNAQVLTLERIHKISLSDLIVGDWADTADPIFWVAPQTVHDDIGGLSSWLLEKDFMKSAAFLLA